MIQLQKGQVFSIVKYSFSNECFTQLSLCSTEDRLRHIKTVCETSGLKPVGAFIIKSLKGVANA